MPLSIADLLSGTGSPGEDGPDGADGESAARNGLPGQAGGIGGASLLRVANRTLSDEEAGGDVTLARSAAGGAGGNGGAGGSGAAAELLSVEEIVEFGAFFSRTTISTYDDPGAGADGAEGAEGGRADARLWNLSVALAGGDAPGVVSVTTAATGGAGGGGGAGGAGGEAPGSSLSALLAASQQLLFRDISPMGGAAGRGGDGGAGAEGRAVQAGITLRGDDLLLSLDASATGGAGGSGGRGGAGGLGGAGEVTPTSPPVDPGDVPPGGDGGAGGAGGVAFARLTGLDLGATGALDLTITLAATGGDGGDGGAAGPAGLGRARISETNQVAVGQSYSSVRLTPGEGGAGGDGGRAGDASARLLDSTIHGGDGADTVLLRLTATGGTGGAGGAGSPAVAEDSVIVVTNGLSESTVTAGAEAGPDGADGAHGDAFVLLRNVTVELGGGDDALRLELLATGPGANRVVVRDSVFDGGEGWDSISFGAGRAGEATVFVDVGAGTVRFTRPGAPATVLSGFEEFVGTGGNDRFRDGAGDQTYSGGGSDDLFVFFARNPGHDRILDAGEGDVVALRGFGARLDSFAEVLGAAADVSGGVLITTGAASSVWLGGVSVAALTADMFVF